MKPSAHYFGLSVAVLLMVSTLASAAPSSVDKAKAAADKAKTEQAAAQKDFDARSVAATKATQAVAAAEKTLKEATAAQKNAKGDKAPAAKQAVQRATQALNAARKQVQSASQAKTAAQKQLSTKASAARKAAAKVPAEQAYAARKAVWDIREQIAKLEKTLATRNSALKKATSAATAAKKAAEKKPDNQALAKKSTDAAKAVEKAANDKAAVAKQIEQQRASLTPALDKASAAHAVALGGLKPITSKQWDYTKARHLLFRAGFGGSPKDVQKLYDMGLYAAVDHLVDYHDRPQANIEISIARLERPLAYEDRLESDERSKISDRRTKIERAQQAELRYWWLRRMVESPRPLQEKLTLFWHDHFAVQYRVFYRTNILYKQNQMFRNYAAENFSALLHGIVHDPAMIRYLDNHQNYKGSGNENLGRELQELFSLGEEYSANHKSGGYTEEDVREASRALTGYNYDSWTDQFIFLGSRHDETKKKVLGRTGNWSGGDVVNIILRHPSTARYVSKKLFEFLAHRDPDEATIDQLAHVLRENHYELRPMLKNLFLSEQFYSDKARGAHIKSPVELMVGTIRVLDMEKVDYRSVDSAIQNMDMTLFEPPNVAGWDEGRAWVNADRILTRYNYVANLVDRSNVDIVATLQGTALNSPDQVVDHLIKRCLVIGLSAEQRKGLIDFLGPLPPSSQWEQQRTQINAKLRSLLVLIMSMPEYQVS